MTWTAHGEVAFGTAMPQILAAFGPMFDIVTTQYNALLNFKVVPPSFAADLALCNDMLRGLQFNLSIGITPPSIDAQLAIIGPMITSLLLQLTLLNGLKGSLAASAHFYSYAGTVGTIGSELDTELSGGLPGGSGADICGGVLFVATAPAVIAIMAELFGVDLTP